MKTLILTILTVLILGFITPPKETIFIGTITIDNKYNDKVLGFIEFKIDTLLIAREIIQQDRTFKISVTADKDIDIYFRGIGARDSYIQTIKPTQKDTIFLSFKVPREYKKHFGKVVCPKCNKHDKVVPIVYGFHGTISVRHIDSKGYTTYIPRDKKNYFDGGCNISDIGPKYYCERDKIKF
jgi:hypothetical protein